MSGREGAAPPGAHVLLVDDTPEMLFLYGKILRGAGYVVTEANTGLQAIEALDRDPPDLMILDWMMPGMTGLEVLEQARSRELLQHLPVILLTAAGPREDLVAQVFDLGASDFITKPVNRRILIARVQAALDTGRKHQLTVQSRKLSLENTELLAELEQARRVQQAQLPARETACGAWRLSGGLYPCAQVGGDFFDVVDTTEDGCTIALVDVSGHGIAAAMVAAGIRSTLRLLTSNTPLEKVMEHLNVQLCGAGDDHYACVALVRVSANEVRVINAGLPPVVLFAGGKTSSEVSASGIPPGLMPDSTYQSSSFAVQPGLMVVLTSDGFTELFDAPDRTCDAEELRALLSPAVRGELWHDQVRTLMSAKKSRQTDDATLVLLRHDGVPV